MNDDILLDYREEGVITTLEDYIFFIEHCLMIEKKFKSIN